MGGGGAVQAGDQDSRSTPLGAVANVFGGELLVAGG